MDNIVKQFDALTGDVLPEELRIEGFATALAMKMTSIFSDATNAVVISRSMAELQAKQRHMTTKRDPVEVWAMNIPRTQAFTDELAHALREIIMREMMGAQEDKK